MLVDALGEDFLVKLGRYIATCSSIEKLAWIVVVKSNGYEVENDNDVTRMLSLRKATPSLRKKLRAAARLHEAPISDCISSIADRIDAGVTSRNMAVHGVWRPLPGGNFRVEFYDNKGTNGAPDWRVFDAEISMEAIDTALFDAEELLLALINICRELEY